MILLFADKILFYFTNLLLSFVQNEYCFILNIIVQENFDYYSIFFMGKVQFNWKDYTSSLAEQK
jgi:hypothetical protein